MKRSFIGLALVLGAAVSLGAQSPSAGAPGQSRPGATQAPGAAKAPVIEPRGTGRVVGHVSSTEGRPLRGAQVYVMSPALRRSYSARTDAEGRFEVKNLPPAEFTLMASKPGYVGMYYGAKRGGGAAGRPVRVADGQTVEKLDFVLPRACVITGRVLDEYGEPAGEARVEAMKPASIGGRRRLLALDSEQADDLGQFRIYGLDPGDYVVRATLTASFLAVSQDHSAYPPTYYPGTTAVADAIRVPCRAAQETPGVQIAMTRVPTARVSGMVVDSQGRPATAGVTLLPVDEVALGSSMGARTRPDGSFTISNVVAGHYKLAAMSLSSRTPADREMTTTDLAVAGHDIAGLALQIARGATARGRVVADGDVPFDFPLSRLRVGSLMDMENIGIGSGMGSVKDDATFEVPGLLGKRRLTAFGMPDTWTLKTVRAKTGEADQPVAFLPGETVDGFEVVLTNKITILRGSVTDDRNRPVKDYAVGFFPENFADLSADRMYRSKVVRADENGQYEAKGLAPGKYFAVAMTEIDGDEWMDSDYLERLRPIATAVTLNEGETKTLELKLVGM